MVPALLRFAQERGVDATLLGARFGLPEGATEMDDVAIGARASEELLVEVAGLLGEPFLALRLPADAASPLQGRSMPVMFEVSTAADRGDGALAQREKSTFFVPR